MAKTCLQCGAELTENGVHRDCGGDCLACMAVDDPDCARELLELQRLAIRQLRTAVQRALVDTHTRLSPATVADLRSALAASGVVSPPATRRALFQKKEERDGNKPGYFD